MNGADETRGSVPLGINQASIGLGRFMAALAVAASWSAFSLWLAVPWAEEFAGVVGLPVAWSVILGIAIAPGFMNAFQTASLLMRPDGRRLAPAVYPPLTLLIAAYNEAANIGHTLSSIDAQRYLGILDVIVIDDGSADGTSDAAQSAGYPWMRLLRQPRNLGKAAALNRGLELARFELVVTLDADCRLHEGALQRLVEEYLSGQPQTAAVAGAVFVQNTHTNWVTRLQHWDYFHGIAATKRTQAAYGGTLVAQGAFSLYRRDILREIGGWPSCVGEDIVVTWAILRRGWFVGYAQDALCFTRVPETLSGLVRQRARWARGMIEAFRCHPGIVLKRRLTTFLISWNLLFPWIDFTFTFGFIPGLALALFGHYWLVGPVTLALIPTAALVGAVMYRMSASVFARQSLQIARDLPAMIAYTLCYSLILQPASLHGYLAELLGLRKSWGTK
jgi:biofilm PGA synthesis N-glycosyltransferase PgaC